MKKVPEDGEKVVNDPRLGKWVKVLDVSKWRGHDVFGSLKAITRYADGDELWSVSCEFIEGARTVIDFFFRFFFSSHLTILPT